jgi:hypothetical protein
MQRVAYKKQNLIQDRIELLNKFNFIWDVGEASWNEMYSRLTNFHKEFKHCRVSTNYKDKQLAPWICTQRVAYKKEKLSQVRIELLNKLNFVWNTGSEPR